MSLEEIAFLALGGIAVATALLALFVRELIHTILWVAVFFVTLSAIYFLLEAPFLGVLQLGVYAGAVTILLLFGVMVTRKRIFSKEAATGIGAVPLSLAALVVVLLLTAVEVVPSGSSEIATYDVRSLSQALFGAYGGYVILLGLVMLSAVSGAIYLVREGRE
ncbi:MAG: NADH-quinone oxidoreductase subunit J [Candidatus Lutacidiplasmatales archaeon]